MMAKKGNHFQPTMKLVDPSLACNCESENCKVQKWIGCPDQTEIFLFGPRAPTSSWGPFGPLDFVLRALRTLRPFKPRNEIQKKSPRDTKKSPLSLSFLKNPPNTRICSWDILDFRHFCIWHPGSIFSLSRICFLVVWTKLNISHSVSK